MSDVIQAALIGAGAATLGGLIAGALNIGLERVRIAAAREDARRSELRESIVAFFVREREWRVAFEALERGEYKAQEDWIYPLSVALREASHNMTLLVPEEVFAWWRDDYGPALKAFESAAFAFGDAGTGTEAARDAAAAALREAMNRGREKSRALLVPPSLRKGR